MKTEPSKQALREHFNWNKDKFSKMAQKAKLWEKRPDLKTKHGLDIQEFEWCRKRLEKMCFVVVK
jgi:hypothetical protein